MKYLQLIVTFFLIFIAGLSHAQITSTTPPRGVLATYYNGSVYTPFTTTSTFQAQSFPPTSVTIWGWNGSAYAVCTTAAPCTGGGGGGTGTVNSGTAFAPTYYPATGTAVSGATPFNGIQYDSTTGAPTAANASNISAAISCTGGGTANAQTVTCNPPVTSLTVGLTVAWLPVANNTGATTISVNGLAATAVTINSDFRALNGFDIRTGVNAVAFYDGTRFQLLNPQTSIVGTLILNPLNLNGQNLYNSSWIGSGVYVSGEGATITAASTIAPTTDLFHLTGTTSVSTMTPLAGMATSVGPGQYGGSIDFIADAATPFAAGTGVGQFKAAFTTTAGTPYRCTYTPSTGLWYCK